MITLKDSRGKASHTLGFAVLSWLAGTTVLGIAAWKGTYLLAEYGVFIVSSIAPYVVREIKEKSNV